MHQPLLKFNVVYMRPIGRIQHQMNGKAEPTHSAMLSPQEGAAKLIEQAAARIAAYSARKLCSWFAVGGISATGAYGKGSNDFGHF